MITSKANAEHYTWGPQCDGWHLLNSGGLSVIQERMPPGASEQLHYHEHSQQMFYILSGVASFEIDGNRTIINPNESIHVIPNSIHRIVNCGTEDLHFLVISAPKAHGDRINV